MTATLALILAIGGGAAYAVDRINSRDVVNGSIRSIDLKNHKAVRGADVKRNSLTGRQIDERTLKAGGLARIAGREAVDCDPDSSGRFVNCATTTLRLARRSRVLIIVTGNQESIGGPAEAFCRVSIDGIREGLGVLPGEQATDNTSSTSTNGFARTVVPRDPLSPGAHTLALACEQFAGNVRINTPTIAAVAVGG